MSFIDALRSWYFIVFRCRLNSPDQTVSVVECSPEVLAEVVVVVVVASRYRWTSGCNEHCTPCECCCTECCSELVPSADLLLPVDWCCPLHVDTILFGWCFVGQPVMHLQIQQRKTINLALKHSWENIWIFPAFQSKRDSHINPN